jgi:hypothetical protein
MPPYFRSLSGMPAGGSPLSKCVCLPSVIIDCSVSAVGRHGPNRLTAAPLWTVTSGRILADMQAQQVARTAPDCSVRWDFSASPRLRLPDDVAASLQPGRTSSGQLSLGCCLRFRIPSQARPTPGRRRARDGAGLSNSHRLVHSLFVVAKLCRLPGEGLGPFNSGQQQEAADSRGSSC